MRISDWSSDVCSSDLATLGARYVLHSATKFLSGHGDVIAGVVCCADADARMLRTVRAATGGLLHPLAAFLLHRGLQNLAVRVERAQTNAIGSAEGPAEPLAGACPHYPQIGRASCRVREWMYGYLVGGSGSHKTKQKKK